MNYYIKQKVFTLGDRYTIKNQYGDDVYEVQGKIFTLGAKLRILDMAGGERLYIEQELFRLMPRYNIFENGALRAAVKKRFTLFNSRFEVESSSGFYEIDGSLFAMSFNISRDGAPAASVSKAWFSWGDSYEISIREGEDAPLLLAMVIIVDNCLHNGGSGSHHH